MVMGEATGASLPFLACYAAWYKGLVYISGGDHVHFVFMIFEWVLTKGLV